MAISRRGAMLALVGLASFLSSTIGIDVPPLMCTNVGVQMAIRRLKSMPLEELSELQTGKSCARSTIMARIADTASRMFKQANLEALDCVTTRLDEEQIDVYAVMRLCSSSGEAETAATTTKPKWDALILPQIQSVFRPANGPANRGTSLMYHASLIDCKKVVITKSYARHGPANTDTDSDDAPRFKFKSAELWTEPAASNPQMTVVSIKLKVKNEGSAPLHVLLATLKAMDDTSTNKVLVLAPARVDALESSKEVSILFNYTAPQSISLPEDGNYGVYFAHTAVRAHLLEGRLDGKKLKIHNRKKVTTGKLKKEFGDLHLNTRSSLGGSASFSFGVWQLLSIGIVMVVGIVTTLYMRRKSTRVDWSKSIECFKRKPHKHKSSSLEMSSKQASYDPDPASDADLDTLESDGLLSPTIEPPLPPPKRVASKLREKMPAIAMQWRKPDGLRDILSLRRTLKLDATARLDAKRFENLWEEFMQRHNASFAATQRPSSELFLQSMAAAGIICMASGTVGGVEKYVLYAKQSDTSDFFFVSVDILTTNNETNLSIRAGKDTSDSLVQQFVNLVDQQLQLLLK